MKALLQAAALAILILFSGCAILPPALRPPAEAPSGEAPPEPSHNSAVLALLDQARQQSSAGQQAAAGASLERALRIEPRNPVLWQELARLRLSQGQYRQAENLAAKSNTLAGNNKSLRAANWRLIGRARSKRGNLKGAKAAYQRAEQGK